MKVFIKYSYITVFVFLIGFIGVFSFLGVGETNLDAFRTSEKRLPTAQPKWNWQVESVKKYFTKLESYINDVFSFRNELIGLNSSVLYKMGISSNPNKILIGKNGYLFLGNSYDRVIDQIKGKTLFDEKSLKSWSQSFLLRKKYLENQGIPFYMAIVPKKHSVYSEYLPEFISVSDNDNFKQIRENDLGLNIMYLRDTLVASKLYWGDFLYNKTDSHWSQIGAYIGYVEIINQLKTSLPNIEFIKLDKEDFNVLPSPGGQNRHILNITIPVEDFTVQIVKSQKWDANIIKTNYSGDTLPFNYWDDVSYHEKAIVYNNKKPYTLLVLEDSFSIKLSKFLNQSFGKIIYCHYNEAEAEELTQFIEKYKPDLVLYEFGEQSLFRHNQVHSNLLSKALDNSYTSIYKMSGNYLFDNVKQVHQIDNLKLRNDTLSFMSTGNDPFMFLPDIKSSENKCCIIKIDFTVPKQTLSQLFYLTDENAHFDGNHTIIMRAEKGRNVLSFYIPQKDFKRNPVRFDPGGESGLYTIHSIDIMEGE